MRVCSEAGVGERRYSTAAWCSRPARSTTWPCAIAWSGVMIFLDTPTRSATSASSDSMRFCASPVGGGLTATLAHICPCVFSCADASAAAAVNKAKASSEDFMSIPLLIVVAAQIITTGSGRQYRNAIDPVGNGSVRLVAQYAFCDPLPQEPSVPDLPRARAFAKLERACQHYWQNR